MPLELEWRRPGTSARLVNPAGRRRTRASVGSAHFKLLREFRATCGLVTKVEVLAWLEQRMVCC
jgi:hypothetical protein